MRKSGSESLGDEVEIEATHAWQEPSDRGPDKAS